MALDATDLLASPVALLDKSVAEHADRPAVVHRDEVTTYRQLHHAAIGIARQLADEGIVAGDAVALYLGNHVGYLAADLALLRAGVVKVPLNQMLVGTDISHIVGHSGARIVLTSPALETGLPLEDDGTITGTSARAVHLELTRTSDATELPIIAGDPVDHPAPDAPAAYFYTGGTTGKAKGVVHTHASVAINLLSHVVEADVRAGERMLLSTPLSHAAGVFAQTGLTRGATLYLLERFDPIDVVDQIERAGVTWTFMVPTMIYRMLDHLRGRSSVRGGLDTLVYGSAPIAPVRLREAMETLGPVLIQLYGQTEVPNFGTTLSKADHRRALDEEHLLSSCGKASTLASVRVVDEDGHTVFDEAGEVCLTAPYVMREYLDNPEATAETRREGWVHTGDVGVMDRDGYVYLRDRKADMIISGGMNVYTTEVESVLARLAAVSQVAVIGIPDEDWGEAVTALIVVAEGARLDEEELTAHARAELATYKRPKRVEVVDHIPLTPFGKPDKKALRARFWDDDGRQIS